MGSRHFRKARLSILKRRLARTLPACDYARYVQMLAPAGVGAFLADSDREHQEPRVSRIKLASDAGQGSLEQVVIELLAAPDLESALDSTTVPALIHDGSHIVRANRSCARWLGYEQRDVLTGADLRVLTSESDQRSLLAAFGATPAGLPRGQHIQRFVHFGGEPLIANVLVQQSPFHEGGVYLAALEPVSSIQRSSTLLRLLEEAVDHLHDIVFITEAEAIDGVGRRIVFVNRVFSLITGYQPTDVLGKTPNITIGELTDRKALTRIERALKQKQPVHEELLKYGKHGDEYWVELHILPVFDDNGEHTHWVSVQRDITERRLLSQRLVESERLASVGLLSAKLAAEINNPLLLAQASLDQLAGDLSSLLKYNGPPEQVSACLEALQLARSNIQRVATAGTQLRLLAGSEQRKLCETDICEVLDNAVALLLATHEVPGRIERHYEKVPGVMADPSRLMHVFHFALESSVAALLHERMEHNAITIRVRSRGEGVLVSLEDTGVGVPSEIAEQLFTPVGRRGNRSLNQGLGLFIANCLVRELGGTIDVRAREHGGSLLEIFLPVATAFEFVAAPAP